MGDTDTLRGSALSEPVTHELGRAIVEGAGRRPSSTVFFAGNDVRSWILAPVNVPATLAKQSWPKASPWCFRHGWSDLLSSINESSTDFAALEHLLSTFLEEQDVLPRARWIEDHVKWIDSHCSSGHVEAAKVAANAVADSSAPDPEIALSPEGGLALNWFFRNSAMSLIVENDVCVLVETHPRYSLQMTFDSVEDSEFKAEISARLANFFSSS